RFTEVELQASLIAGALEGNLRTAPEVGSLVSAVVLGVVGTLLAVAMSAAAVPSVIGLMLLGVSIFTGWNTVAYARLDWVLPLGSGLLMLFGLALINLVASYLLEGRARRAVIRLFGQYVAPQLVARMADDPHHAPLQSQDKELTILFADIRGFTRMAERMDPQQLREVLNRFLTVMTEVVHAHQGTLDKYIGDAVMAFWGAPLEDAQHADHAVAAAIAMQEALDDLNLEFARRGLPALSMGIGINTGVVRVGDMGSQLRRSYTVIGDAVNLAARLEGISKDQGIPVAVGDSTRRQVNALALEFVGQLQVQGRDEAVRVWQPVTLRSAVWSQPAAPEPLANRMIESREPLESSGRRDLIEQLGPGEQRHSRERVA
ncbi:MAG: adenylate/guanylate cyclase domain-containing protein, partial [Burkholderiales bacterium]